MSDSLTIAMIRDVFWEADGARRLWSRLVRAREDGAGLAVLPELPLNAWCPARREPRDEDAEPAEGERHRALAEAARASGVAVLGGAIVRGADGRRRNTALLFDAEGTCVGRYEKLHLPDEPGFWETCHYEPADTPPAVVEACGFRLGIQLCSDVNRPAGSHLLGALGAEAILAPRATEGATFDRWRLMLRANAMASATYVLSVTRPAPEDGVPLGGPSIAIGPDGEVLLETYAEVATVTLHRAALQRARRDYPGYLPVRADLYAKGWASVTP